MTTPADVPAPTLTIGEVMNDLADEFPEVSVSKIRFLEAEGLIYPARTGGGVRRFSAADIERLRYVLTLQRDYYLPLRVIRERLTQSEVDGDDSEDDDTRAPVTRRELIAASGLTTSRVREAEEAGLLPNLPSGALYPAQSVEICVLIAGLLAMGVEIRHLRPLLAAVEREAELIRARLAPMACRRDSSAPGLVRAEARDTATTLSRLHTVLLETRVASDLADLIGDDPADLGSPRHP